MTSTADDHDLARATPESVDDWESHWSQYADVASKNPAQTYRRLAIIEAIRSIGRPSKLLDIGSGQGDLLADLSAEWPDAELLGVELSAEGIRWAGEKVPSARFVQLDLLSDSPRPADVEAWADLATCSEVLEHVERPEVLLRAGAWFVRPGGYVVITVPGGPRTAFDKHIGHRRHFTADALRSVIEQAGLEPVRVSGTGFPFFDLYKLVVLARGEKVIDDGSSNTEPSRLAELVLKTFGVVLRPGLTTSRFGWQLVAVARVPW
jgi:2-polyprenyl-3-methyl-5-hydroxy-6-metoxy-1,4-benzoquinol methylase